MRPILLLAFIVVPLVELWIVLQLRDVIGLDWTLLGLLVVSIVGAVLVKREGIKAWQRFRRAVVEARIPAEEAIDGVLVLFGGALMLTPGFLTDAVGLLLVFPLSRTGINRLVRSRVRSAFGVAAPGQRRPGPSGQRPAQPQPRVSDDVIDVDVVSIERDEPTDGDEGGEGPSGQRRGGR